MNKSNISNQYNYDTSADGVEENNDNTNYILVKTRFIIPAVIMIVLIGSLIYSNTLEIPLVFDDVINIQTNSHIRLTAINFSSIKNFFTPIAGRPTAALTFALNYYFGQYNVIGYHIINIAIHIITAILLFLVINVTLNLPAVRFSKSYPAAIRPETIAFMATLLWLVNPLDTESVTYIVQRMNSMAAMFYLLALWFYIRGRNAQRALSEGGAPASHPIVPRICFIGTILAGFFAVTSKENAAMLPVFILVYEWFFFQDLKPIRFKWICLGILIVAITFVLTVLFYLGNNIFTMIQNFYTGKQFSVIERVMSEWRVIIYYIGLLLFPQAKRLNLDYDYPMSYSLFHPPTTIISLTALTGLLLLAFYTAKKDRLISFSILWFFGNLVIESTVIGLALVFEHRTYLPSMLFFLIVTFLILRHIKPQSLAFSLLGAAIIISAYWTYQRNLLWNQPIALWADCVLKSPEKSRPNYNLALAYHTEGDLEKALSYYQKALEYHPDIQHESKIYANLGNVFIRKKEFKIARSYLSKAIHINPSNSNAYLNLGDAELEEGHTKAAIRCYQTAIRLAPDKAKPHNNYGKALILINKETEAIAEFQIATRLSPDFAEAYNNLGNALVSNGEIKEAISKYQKAAALDPQNDQIENNIGLVYVRIGQFDEAIRHFRQAVSISPGNSEAKKNLIQIKHFQEIYNSAVSRLNEKIAKDPNDPQLYFQLGEIYRRFYRFDFAINSYKKALALLPKFSEASFNLAVIYASRHQYDQAIDSFKKSGTTHSVQATAYYNIACLYARQNKRTDAVKWLKNAIDAGYNNWEQIRSDKDLAAIRSTAWYQTAIKEH